MDQPYEPRDRFEKPDEQRYEPQDHSQESIGPRPLHVRRNLGFLLPLISFAVLVYTHWDRNYETPGRAGSLICPNDICGELDPSEPPANGMVIIQRGPDGSVLGFRRVPMPDCNEPCVDCEPCTCGKSYCSQIEPGRIVCRDPVTGGEETILTFSGPLVPMQEPTSEGNAPCFNCYLDLGDLTELFATTPDPVIPRTYERLPDDELPLRV